MIRRIVQFGALSVILGLPSVEAAVYRCESPAGGVIYSDEPCGDGKLLNIEIAPSSGTQGLRPAEREFLRQRDEERAAAREKRERRIQQKAAAAPLFSCDRIEVREVRYFNKRQARVIIGTDGEPHSEVNIHRCAAIEFILYDFSGRLRPSAQDHIAAALIALFADRTASGTDSAELNGGPGRLGSREVMSAKLCFGYHPDEIVQLACR